LLPFLHTGEEALEPHQLQELAAARSGGHITLVAIDATWAGAVKMRRKYPPGEDWGGGEPGGAGGQQRGLLQERGLAVTVSSLWQTMPC
jgi:hypothetical protein